MARSKNISEANVLSETPANGGLTEVLDIFDSQSLNVAATKIHKMIEEYAAVDKQLRDIMANAFVRRWMIGKIVYENYDEIIAECGTQAHFASMIGVTEAMISNNKRGYENLLTKAGCTTPDDVLKFLSTKRIEPTSRNFEKIGALIELSNNDEGDDRPTTRRERQRRSLEAASSEVDRVKREIIGDPETQGVISDNTEHVFSEDIEHLEEHMSQLKIEFDKIANPATVPFRSKTYLSFIRATKYDVVEQTPCESVDAHHANEFESAGVGQKINDLCVIPVSRESHQMLERGIVEYTETELLRIQRDLLIRYIMEIHTQLDIK